MKRRTAVLFFLMMGLLLCSGCTKKEENVQVIQPEQGRFQVEAPASWCTATGKLGKTADIELMDSKKSVFFMIVSSDKSTIKGSLDSHLKNELDKINASYLPTEMETSKVKMGSYDGTLYSFRTIMQSLSVHMNIYIFETEHYFAKAYAWGLPGDVSQNQDALNGILASVTEQTP